MERRPEDHAVEEGVKEVLALSQAHRPKNTYPAVLPAKAKGVEGEFVFFNSSVLSFYFISFFYIVP
jgi:hypothetical protein